MRKNLLLVTVLALVVGLCTAQANTTTIKLNAGNSYSQAGTVLVTEVGPETIGTGFIDSFMRIQAPPSSYGQSLLDINQNNLLSLDQIPFSQSIYLKLGKPVSRGYNDGGPIPTPEPASLIVLGIGLIAFAFIRRKPRQWF
jgi:hypothetical protein